MTFVVAVLLALVFAAFRSDLQVAQVRSSQGSHVVSTPCGPIEYGTAGTGPPVLIVHGAGGGYDQGLAFGRDLARHAFQVIAISRFGYLRTPLPADASAAAQAHAQPVAELRRGARPPRRSLKPNGPAVRSGIHARDPRRTRRHASASRDKRCGLGRWHPALETGLAVADRGQENAASKGAAAFEPAPVLGFRKPARIL